jgi:DNA-binding CsgD family transcriptional regulator
MYWGCRTGGARNTMIGVRTRTNRRNAGEKRGTEAAATARSSVTPREIEVLRLLSHGCTYVEVAGRLRMSVHTVASHIKKSYRKLGVHSAAAAVTRAADLHLFDREKG